MRWTNYHCHNSFCDGRAEPEAFVKAAIEKKFETLGFSSHAPVPVETSWNMKVQNFDSYLKKVSDLKELHQNEITIYTGLEVDFIPNFWGVSQPLIKNAKTDYLISSVHFLDGFETGERWAIDGSIEYFINGFQEIFQGDSKQIVRRFTETSAQMMAANGFDIVGHIDKIYQHGHRFFNVSDPWYRKEVISLLKFAQECDVIVEINTKSFHKLGFFYPHQSFFKEMHQIGNKITINSDTHDPEMMDTAFEPARTMLLEAGYKNTFELHKGQWIDRPLN